MAEAERKIAAGQNVHLREEELARQLRREAAIFSPERRGQEEFLMTLPPTQRLPQEKKTKTNVLRQNWGAGQNSWPRRSLPEQEMLPPPFPQEKETLGEGESDYEAKTAPAHIRKDGVLQEGESDYEAKTAPAYIRKDGLLQEGESAYDGSSFSSLDSSSIDKTEIRDAKREGEKSAISGPLDRTELMRGFKMAAVLGKPRGIKAWGEDEF